MLILTLCRPRAHFFVILILCVATNVKAAITLSGPWIISGAPDTTYEVAATSDPASFEATCKTQCATWSSATINITDAAQGFTLISFTGQHRNHTGHVALPSTNTLSWSDGSLWERAAPAPDANYTIDVIVVPHSHDDAGWQRTFEGYYRDETVKILNNVVEWLTTTPTARFIWVETSFLQRWWVDQNQTQRDRFTALLASGRLELVGGGWTMHDEESTTVYSAASNMESGLTWLQRTFGAAVADAARPKVLWHIDPSGHALVTPTLAALLGYDALVIDRIPDPVRQAFRRNGSLQFVWTGTTAQDVSTPILTTVLDSFYCNPGIGGSTSASHALSFYADVLRRVDSYRSSASGRVTILWPWGCDFAFQSMSDFDSMTGALAYMSKNPDAFPRVSARFGTLSEYFSALHAESIAFPMQGRRDFHPYVWCYEPQDAALCHNLPTTPDPFYWRTGMYTSKSQLKGDSRTLDASLHAADIAYALQQLATTSQRNVESSSSKKHAAGCLRGSCNLTRQAKDVQETIIPPPALQSMLPLLGTGRATSALMTHHDAITGTAYISCSLGPPTDDCNCYEDYIQRMKNATLDTESVIAYAKSALLQLPTAPPGSLSFGNATLATLQLSPTNALALAIGNPSAWHRREVVRLGLLGLLPSGYGVSVIDTRARNASVPIVSQVVHDTLRGSTTLYALVDVPALTTVVYVVSLVQQPHQSAGDTEVDGDVSSDISAHRIRVGQLVAGAVTLSNGLFSITFDDSGRISGWSNSTPGGLSIPLRHTFSYYRELLPGSNLIGGTVYGFEPLNGSTPERLDNISVTIPVTVMANGPLVWEAAQAITPWLTHTTRLFAPPSSPDGDGYAAGLGAGWAFEFQSRLGPLPFARGEGGSIVSQFTPGAGCDVPGATSPTASLTTDTSGFQTLTRPPHDPMKPVQGQVYPTWPGWDFAFGACDSAGAGGGGVLSHVVARPMGTATVSNTSVWQMLHRRLNNPSDDRGNESTVVDDVVTVSLADDTSGWHGDAGSYFFPRQVTARLVTHPLTLHAMPVASLAAYLQLGAPSYSPSWMHGTLPPGLHLHSFLSRDGWYPPSPTSGANGGGGDVSGSAIAVRLQQLPYAPPSTFNLTAWLQVSGAVTSEVSIDLNAQKASLDARRMHWRTDEENDVIKDASGKTASFSQRLGSGVIAFDGEIVRSFLITTQPPFHTRQ